MKILYVSTIASTINAFMIPHIKLLIEQGHYVDIACNIDREISSSLTERGCQVFNIEFQRSPLKKSNYIAYKNLKTIIKKGGYDTVHTHTPVASACVRLACRKMKNVKVIYTAHGFHFYTGAPLKNWLIYYLIERNLAKYTDVLITINKEDYERAKNSFNARRIEYVPGVGLDTRRFDELVVDKAAKRKEIGVPEDAVVILSVGELNKNKNHQTVIRGIAKLNRPNIYYVICGRGELENSLRNLSKELGIEDQVKLLGYRTDIAEICKVADIFAFPSFREGLPVSLMEAMASKLPVVCSNIRGNNDLIQEGKGGFLIHPINDEGFAKAIDKLLESRVAMGEYNFERIQYFSLNNVKEKMKEIYKLVGNEAL